MGLAMTDGLRIGLCAVLAAAVAAVAIGSGPAAAGDAETITACFDRLPAGPDQDAAGDAITDYVALTEAASPCQAVVQDRMTACVAAADTAGDDPAAYYDCVGLGANACIDSDWAKSEFHRFACADIEETFWLGILDDGLDRLSATLKGADAPSRDDLKASFSAYRNEKCELLREVSKSEPLFSYAACSTEANARMAIDMRILGRAMKGR